MNLQPINRKIEAKRAAYAAVITVPNTHFGWSQPLKNDDETDTK